MTRFNGNNDINATSTDLCLTCGMTYRDHYMGNCPAVMPVLAAHKSEGKPLVGDIDPTFELCIGEVLAASLVKYPNDANGMPNWWKGGSYRSFGASTKRHLAKWLAGEDFDEESGLPHLWHVATDSMFLISWQGRGVGQDDRLRCSEEVL